MIVLAFFIGFAVGCLLTGYTAIQEFKKQLQKLRDEGLIDEND